MSSDALSDTAARARAWHHARHVVCDVIEPWAHGTVVRATRYPDVHDLNAVRVEEDPAMSVEELVAFADEALSELEHRRMDFDLVEPAESLRGGLEAHGWEATRLLWMRHEAPLPPGPDIAVEAVSYDAVQDLRLAWSREDFPDHDHGAFLAQRREVDLSQEVQVLAVRERSVPVAFAQLHQRGAAAEITHVYVHSEQRGNLLGTALTRAAIDAAGPSGIFGSLPTTRPGRRSFTHDSVSAPYGLPWNSSEIRRSAFHAKRKRLAPGVTPLDAVPHAA